MLENLIAEKAMLETEYENLCEKNHKTWCEYDKMEGMYGTKTYEIIPLDGHCRPYVYKYAEGMEEKERAEREQFLIDNHYDEISEMIDKINDRLEEIEEKICIEKHGMSRKKYGIAQNIKSLERQIAKKQKELETYKKKFEEED